MLTFLTSGVVGNLRFGLEKTVVMDRLGKPRDWVGKPPGFGPAITDPMTASIWNFYGGAIGVCFDESSKVAAIIARINNIEPDRYPFANWPQVASWTIGRLVGWLDENAVGYQLSREDEVPGWLVVCDKCVALSQPDVSRSSLGRFLDERLVTLTIFDSAAAATVYRRTGEFRFEPS